MLRTTLLAGVAAVGAGCSVATVAFMALKRAERLRRQVWEGQKVGLEDFLADANLSFVLFAAAGGVVAAAIAPVLVVPVLVGALVLSRRMPSMLEARKLAELRESCEAELATMADIVVLGLRAGLTFDAALSLFCAKFDSALSCEIERGLLRWKGGLCTRAEALDGIAERVDSAALRRFSQTVVHALANGSPLADMLERFSADVRLQQQATIERKVEKAPVKMLIPMGVCILPAMLILVMGPVMLQFSSSGL